jgi:hypothetical protein
MGIAKIMLGLILAIVGLWALIPLSWGGAGFYVQFIEVFKGVVPVLIIFIGAILVWVEWEELRLEKPKRKK